MVECDVGIYRDSGFVMLLDSGICSVGRFFDMADDIPSAIRVTHSFNCNVDVDLKGADLIRLIGAQYPDRLAEARHRIDPDEVYTVICYDLS